MARDRWNLVGREISSPNGALSIRQASAPLVSDISLRMIAFPTTSAQFAAEAMEGRGKTVQIDFCRHNKGKLEVYMTLTLSNTVISYYSTYYGQDSSAARVKLCLNFTKIEHWFIGMGTTGKTSPPLIVTHDRAFEQQPPQQAETSLSETETTRSEPMVDWQSAAESLGVSRALLNGTPGLILAAHRLTVARQLAEAEAAYVALLKLEPRHRSALLNVVNLLLTQGRQADAAVYRRRLVEMEVDALGLPPEEKGETLEFRLAKALLGPSPDRAPASYVARAFDAYAENYDQHLQGTLQYRGPETLFQATIDVLGEVPPASLDVLDLGCGTGLAAPLFRRLSQRLDGLDLSASMLEKARATGLYDGLERGDLTEWPLARPGRYDLVLALDVLNYLGDLAPAMNAAAISLRVGGWFALSAEAGRSPAGYALGAAGRFTHSEAYLVSAAKSQGFEVVSRTAAVLRKENNRDVESFLFVLRRGADAR